MRTWCLISGGAGSAFPHVTAVAREAPFFEGCRQGGVKLDKFVDIRTGRPFTLEELAMKEGLVE